MWIGYLSATSVYGDHQGAYVDEDSPTAPTSPRGLSRLACEHAWLELGRTHKCPVHIFRLSGIYGPGRNALSSILTSQPQLIDSPNHAFSRIHVDDICQTLIASMQNPQPTAIYNLADDLPAASAEVYEYGYHLLGRTAPARVQLQDADLSPMAQEFYRDSKRIDNQRIKEMLNITLLYPTYKEGLCQCLGDLKENMEWQS